MYLVLYAHKRVIGVLCVLFIRVYLSSTSKDGQRSKSNDVVVSDDAVLVKQQLWVDQYSPQHFTELLSDDVSLVVVVVVVFWEQLLSFGI